MKSGNGEPVTQLGPCTSAEASPKHNTLCAGGWSGWGAGEHVESTEGCMVSSAWVGLAGWRNLTSGGDGALKLGGECDAPLSLSPRAGLWVEVLQSNLARFVDRTGEVALAIFKDATVRLTADV